MAVTHLDVETKNGYETSLENLGIMKLFNDEGIDISGFPKFWYLNPYDGYNLDSTFDIFYAGVSSLFVDVEEHLPYNEKDDGYFHQLVEKGIIDFIPEFAVVIKDTWVQEVLRTKEGKKLAWAEPPEMDMETLIDQNDQSWILSFQHYGMLHYAAKHIIEQRKKMLELHSLQKTQEKRGEHREDQHRDRRKSA